MEVCPTCGSRDFSVSMFSGPKKNRCAHCGSEFDTPKEVKRTINQKEDSNATSGQRI